MNKIILACFIIAMSACGSNPPPQTQFFVLTPNPQANINPNESSNKVVMLEQIVLAKYLDQPGIVMQTDMHQIKVAHYHRWAEPLKRNMRRYLSETLDGKLSYPVTLDNTNLSNSTNVLSLQISVNQFNGVTDGTAVLSGEWILFDEDTQSILRKEMFRYQKTLVDEGYTELVNQLAVLLDKLCADIANKM